MRIAIAGGTGLLGGRLAHEAEGRGHEVRLLSRATGIDLTRPDGAVSAAAQIEGCDAVIDVLSIGTQNDAASIAFFESTTRALLAAERRAGVGHHIALSIVGVDRAPTAYYAGKVAQERAVHEGPVPWTILRATQFHEFAAQMFTVAARGRIHLAPRMRTQPIAADEVARHLVDLAEMPACGRVPDLAGPHEESLVDMIRRYARATGHRGWIPAVSLPGSFGRAMRDGRLLPSAGATIGRQSFAEWIASLG